MMECSELEQADLCNATLEYAKLPSIIDRNIFIWKEITHSKFEVQFHLYSLFIDENIKII